MKQYPFIFSDETKYRLQRHFAFWIFWWLFQGFLYSFIPAFKISYWTRLPISIVDSLVFLPCHMFLSYSLMYFVIPKYLVKGKYIATGIWVIALFLATASFSALISLNLLYKIRVFVFPSYTFLPSHPLKTNFHLSLLAGLRGGITIGGLGAAIKLMKYWYIKEQRNLQLQKENAEAQVQLLKAQVHPHFLFNTLNNIYSYTQDTSPVASQLVMGLSDMLRYMLYECNQPTVHLSKELKMIQDYITLEKIRYDDQFDVHIEMPEDTRHLAIAPLLLLPLVENCFKHGTSHMLDQPWLSLQVSLTGNNMHMKLVNGKIACDKTKSNYGIGISNVRKRLDLLYPGKSELVITDDIDVFIVNLRLQLEPAVALQKKEAGMFTLTYHE